MGLLDELNGEIKEEKELASKIDPAKDQDLNRIIVEYKKWNEWHGIKRSEYSGQISSYNWPGESAAVDAKVRGEIYDKIINRILDFPITPQAIEDFLKKYNGS